MQTINNIGIFDSGAGGLTVLKSLIEEVGFNHIVYYGDTARVPYGNKDTETIRRFSLEALEFFSNFGLDLLVVACNTASAHALHAMQECSKIPIIGVIESGIAALTQQHIAKDKHILVIATEATIKSDNYAKSLRNLGYTNITSLATNLFVSLVEEHVFSGEVVDSVLRHYFPPTLKPDVVILGCTHFPLLLLPMQRYFGSDVKFIHSGEAIACYVREHFKIEKNSKNLIDFFASDNVARLKSTAKLWLKEGTYIMNER
ncbi:glutamate racemase [Helicobacter bilis]|uniref:Glutamate racemase n=2 Tax=Helicobacter bilis TaxID=37372 RepID=A0A6D2CCH2_9HELI|nr:glutamate racemase [Helicobacter bilis]EMZ37872.1 glutamate racemase [Helicobacter bilis WiWa]TLE04413.1 glutamate racemase [Helicobacter bilis]TLE05409.1 glutamate racemase [Helicobacter bilis]